LVTGRVITVHVLTRLRPVWPWATIICSALPKKWASSAVGSAREWHSRGHRFDPGLVHQPSLLDPREGCLAVAAQAAKADIELLPTFPELRLGEPREGCLAVAAQAAKADIELLDQYGRMAVSGDRLIDSFRREPRSLSQTVASIQRLVALQARAARGGAESDAAYVAALKNSDIELRMWALRKAKDRVKVPSPALTNALLASWPTAKEIGPVLGSWNAAGLVANNVVAWRLQRSAPFFARILTTSASGDERAWAAMALGGSGDRTYLPLLRRVAAEDAHAQARALAYHGIMYMLGPDSLGDLRLGAKDSDARVRARVVSDAYNLLELGRPKPRWPPPSNALIAEVREFLNEMRRDPTRSVRDSAKSVLAMIARQR
jgi:hypothetical protein